jgi:hypothetical protein
MKNKAGGHPAPSAYRLVSPRLPGKSGHFSRVSPKKRISPDIDVPDYVNRDYNICPNPEVNHPVEECELLFFEQLEHETGSYI